MGDLNLPYFAFWTFWMGVFAGLLWHFARKFEGLLREIADALTEAE